jgi:DNA-binding GntR family transcriptional regulator
MTHTDTINRTGPIPIYEQIAAILRAEIEGQPPGTRVPSEPDLMERFGVAQITARRAHRLLAEEGLVEIIKGRGTFTLGPVPAEAAQ